MAYDEFLGVMSSTGLVTEEFAEREVTTAFAMSMMTQVDEINKDRHMKMERVVFYNFIARCAEILSLAPLVADSEQWPEKSVKIISQNGQYDPCHTFNYKIKNFKERFRKPEKDQQDLYIVPSNKNLAQIFCTRLPLQLQQKVNNSCQRRGSTIKIQKYITLTLLHNYNNNHYK